MSGARQVALVAMGLGEAGLGLASRTIQAPHQPIRGLEAEWAR